MILAGNVVRHYKQARRRQAHLWFLFTNNSHYILDWRRSKRRRHFIIIHGTRLKHSFFSWNFTAFKDLRPSITTRKIMLQPFHFFHAGYGNACDKYCPNSSQGQGRGQEPRLKDTLLLSRGSKQGSREELWLDTENVFCMMSQNMSIPLDF